MIAPRKLGPGGPWIAPVGFGGMALSFPERPSEGDAIRLLHAVLDRGVTLLDTADIYAPDERELGHNERLISKALRTWGGRRDIVTIATKGGYTRRNGRPIPNGHPGHLRRACEHSLRALRVEAIDLYQLHTRDPTVPFADSIMALDELRVEGKVRWIGLSNMDVVRVDAARAMAPIQSVQNQLSLQVRDSLRVGPVAWLERKRVRWLRRLRLALAEPFQSGVVSNCARHGLAFLAYSPLGGAQSPRLAGHPALEAIARSHGVSVYAIAIAWLLAQSDVVIPIPSARTVEHALDALTGAEVRLADDELAAVSAVTL